MRGFTLVEILLVTILVSVIIGFSAYWYNKIYQSGFLLDESAFLIVNFLNLAKQKAMLGEENDHWGVWLVNNQKNPDYLYLFKGTTSSLRESFSLPEQIDFLNPPLGSSKTIIFRKLTGETTSTAIQIGFANSSLIKYIVVPTSASIYVTSTYP